MLGSMSLVELRRVALVLIVALRVVASVGQTAVTAPAVVAPPPVFEVTTIKVSKAGDSGSNSSFNGGRFSASNVSLKNVMQYQAYGIPELRILGGPKWLGTARFDIEAKADDAMAAQLEALDRVQRRAQMQAMYQQLLADRFKLTTHWETRELPIYALVVGKNGPKLSESKGTDGSSGTSANDGQFNARNVTMAQFAGALTQELSRELGRVVVDKTGVVGRYDLAMKWTPDEIGAASADAGPSIFTEIQEQLGLKLESSKGPVKVLVVDRVEMPSEN